jgi:hypothetical protein
LRLGGFPPDFFSPCDRRLVDRGDGHHSHNLAPQLGILDLHEYLCQREPIVCGKKFVQKVRRPNVIGAGANTVLATTPPHTAGRVSV